jgi:phosphatidate cytidylyltransferase
MKTRAITGFFFIIVMLASMLLGHYPFGIFYLLLSGFCLYEFYKLAKHSGAHPNVGTGLLNGIFIYAVFALLTYQPGVISVKSVILLPITLVAIFIQELYNKTAAPLTNIAWTFLGLIFVTMPFTFFHALAYVTGSFNFHFPLAFFLMLWANDTGAYLVGRSLGRTKLFERHSPKKTWEGFIGGVLISAGVGLIIAHYFTDLGWKQWVSVAILISCFGTLGDLVESMFKRSINVKDSGGILPGHGGLLDRFDGLLLAAPVVFTYIYLNVN